jgi:hypothetical protein
MKLYVDDEPINIPVSTILGMITNSGVNPLGKMRKNINI